MRARKLKITLSFCALVLLGLNARADTEDWYTFWSFGFANHQYAEPFESAMDRLEALPGVSRTEIAIDMLGFYWPVGDQSKTIAGFVINGSADRLNDSFDHIQLNQYLYGASIMHFFGREPGDGLFVRGDIGVAKLLLSDSFGTNLTSDSGSGFVIGIGYGIPVSAESRLILSVTSANRSVEGDDYKAIAFNIGGLW